MLKFIGWFTFSLVVLSGCATQKDIASCDQRDWYTLGRNDGARGAGVELVNRYKSECLGNRGSGGWETIYLNGRNAGLVEYCTAENGYELGRMGVIYHYVCPSTVEPKFLETYRRGQKARDLEVANQRLAHEIEDLNSQLSQSQTNYERRSLASEIENLQNLRAENEKQLSLIVKSL